jgi:hypothetical protein
MDRASLARYLLSLPERVVRSASALAAGLLRELGNVTLPAAVRRTSLYRTMVEATLRFLIEEVGQVEGVYPPATALAKDFLARKAVGHGMDWVGILAFRASPVWVMAALADLSGTGRHLIREISEQLRREGLLSGDAHFETVDQLLDGLESSAGQLTTALNTPPIRVADLRAEWELLRKNVGKLPALPSIATLQHSWDQLRQEAAAQERPVFQLAALMSIATIARMPENLLWLGNASVVGVHRTGELLAQTLLDHYAETLRDIRSEGLTAWWFREFKPYLRAAAEQFSPRRLSLTQRILQWRRGGGATLT